MDYKVSVDTWLLSGCIFRLFIYTFADIAREGPRARARDGFSGYKFFNI